MKYAIGILIVLVVGIGIIMIISSQKGSNTTKTPPPANSGNQSPNSQSPNTSTNSTGTPNQAQPKKRETGTRSGVLVAVGGSGIKGDASISFKDGKAAVGVKITGAAEPGNGRWYEAHLTNSAGDFQYLGRFSKQQSEPGTYVAGSQGPEPWLDYDKVVVSLDSKDDKKPEQVVAETTLTLR